MTESLRYMVERKIDDVETRNHPDSLIANVDGLAGVGWDLEGGHSQNSPMCELSRQSRHSEYPDSSFYIPFDIGLDEEGRPSQLG